MLMDPATITRELQPTHCVTGRVHIYDSYALVRLRSHEFCLALGQSMSFSAYILRYCVEQVIAIDVDKIVGTFSALLS